MSLVRAQVCQPILFPSVGISPRGCRWSGHGSDPDNTGSIPVWEAILMSHWTSGEVNRLSSCVEGIVTPMRLQDLKTPWLPAPQRQAGLQIILL